MKTVDFLLESCAHCARKRERERECKYFICVYMHMRKSEWAKERNRAQRAICGAPWMFHYREALAGATEFRMSFCLANPARSSTGFAVSPWRLIIEIRCCWWWWWGGGDGSTWCLRMDTNRKLCEPSAFVLDHSNLHSSVDESSLILLPSLLLTLPPSRNLTHKYKYECMYVFIYRSYIWNKIYILSIKCSWETLFHVEKYLFAIVWRRLTMNSISWLYLYVYIYVCIRFNLFRIVNKNSMRDKITLNVCLTGVEGIIFIFYLVFFFFSF